MKQKYTLIRDYVLGFRHESQIGNKDGDSKDFLTRKHGHHHSLSRTLCGSENQKVLMCPYLQHIWFVIENANTYSRLILLSMLIVSTSPSLVQGQIDTIDPLNKVRDLITDEEILLFYTEQVPADQVFLSATNLYNYDGSSLETVSYGGLSGLYTPHTANQPPYPAFSGGGGASGPGTTDVTKGHFFKGLDDQSPRAEAFVFCWAGEDAQGNAVPLFAIQSPQPSFQCLDQNVSGQGPAISPGSSLGQPILNQTDLPQIKVTAGNFIDDANQASYNAEDEIAFAFTDQNGMIKLYLYEPLIFCWETVSEFDPDIPVPFAQEIASVQVSDYKDDNTLNNQVLDIAAGDFDNDGFDEIAATVVKANEELWVFVYEVDNGQLSLKYSNKVVHPEDQICCPGNPQDLDMIRAQVRITSDDFYYHTPGDEILLGFYFQEVNNAGDYTGINLLPIRENESGTGLIFDLPGYQKTYTGAYAGMDRFHISSGDLDGQKDNFAQEAVMAINGEVVVMDFDTTVNGEMTLTERNTFAVDFTMHDENENFSGKYSHSFIDVGNMQSVDPAMGSVSLNDFAEEIVVVTNVIDYQRFNSPYIKQTFHIETYGFPEVNGELDITQDPTLLAERNQDAVVSVDGVVSLVCQYSIGLADVDGGGVSLGNPIRRDVADVVTPVVVINAPPTHFDVFDDDTLDINNLYDAGLESADIDARTDRTVYRETTGMSTTFSSTISSDWALSTSVTAGFESPVVQLSGSLSRTYGEKFSNISESTREIQFTTETTSLLRDNVIGYLVDYDIYEYPVLFNGNTQDTISYVIVAIPEYPENTTTIDQSALSHDYQVNHQHGNLFSYAHSTDDLSIIAGNEQYNLGAFQMNESSNTESKKVLFSEATSNTISSEQTTQHTFEANAGFSYQGLSIGGSVSGEYNQSELNTRNTRISNTKEFEVYFERPEQGLTPFDYTTTPYLFWDINGAIVMDFTTQVDNTANNLFDNFYDKIDPAFLLPQIHDPEKGINVPVESRRYRTKEIKVYPEAVAGRTVTIFTRVQNYGFQSVQAGLPVCFYYLEENGTLQSIGCETIGNAIAGRTNDFGSEVIQMEWTVPLSLTPDKKPKIVAIIDPQNLFQDEVHDYPNADGISNNIAWNCLYSGNNCGDIMNVNTLFLDNCSGLTDIVTLDQANVPSGHYVASNKIVLSGKVPNGNNITLLAPNGLEVMPAAEIELGANFHMQVGDCNE